MKDFWITNNSSLLDRPHHKGFLDHIGVDISGSPMNEQIKRCHNAAVRALGKPNWPSYYKLMEPNSVKFMAALYEKGQNGASTMDMYPWLRQMMLDLTLNITYAARAGDFDDELTNRLLNSLYEITEVRGSTATFRHFVPFLRMWPEKMSKVMAAAKERQRCIDILYGQYLQKVADGEKPQCIVSSLSADKLSIDELHGTCMSLLQAAPDTVSSGVYQCVAWLCSPTGQPFQVEALKAILNAYDGDREKAWEMAFREERVELISSLYKETRRFFATTPFNNRRASQDINLYGTTIPQGMQVTMNIQAVNHDPEHYGLDAYTFKPDRFLGNTTPLPHLSFGTGGRICPAYIISNRIMYAVLTRLLLAFEMNQVEGTRLPSTDMIDFSDAYGLVALPRLYDCAFVARDEVWLKNMLASSV
ncbi:cytochrome P450 [Thozetella sp. PMI_491]|nr:cytochrome P450 [Thozetella sp. PMI_491]